MIKVSIIVPVYNKAPYLQECLDTLTGQTLKDIEIICVDDRSTDDSLDILLLCAKNDNRVKVLPQERNRGLSASRNVGMRAASGEFIAFVDADDLVDKDFFEKLYNASADYDVVKGEIWEYDDKLRKCVISNISDANKKIRETGNPVWFFYGITSAIYRRDFIVRNGLSFSETLFYNEDTVFVVSVVTKLSKIQIVDDAKYYYRFVPNSLSRVFNERTVEGFYLSTLAILGYLYEASLSYDDISIILDQLFTLLSFFINSGLIRYQWVSDIKRAYFSLMKKLKPREIADYKVSVIVPVHNGEAFLRRTLSCLTFQSLYDLEIICVNDGSADESLSIIDEFANDDPRIKIIDCKENGGASKARNLGICSAKGEYLGFMDQDDSIDLLFYKTLYESAKVNDADIVKGNMSTIDRNGQEHASLLLPVHKSPFYFINNWLTGIFRRSMILENNIFQPEGYSLGEDLRFLFDAVSHTNKVIQVPNVYYHYIVHNGSEDAEYAPLCKLKSVTDILEYILSKTENLDFYHRDIDLYLLYYLTYINHMSERLSKCLDAESRKLCIEFIFKCFDSCLAKADICEKLHITHPMIAKCLKENDKTLLLELASVDKLSDVFRSRTPNAQHSSVSCHIISVCRNEALAQKYILSNSFLKGEEISLDLIDNREHLSVSRLFNSYIQHFDHTEESWLFFIRDDLELLSFPADILSSLDKNRIYGPFGAKAFFDQYKVGFAKKGRVYRKDACSNFIDAVMPAYFDPRVDTLDSMCLIVHSSLLKKYDLHFDENLAFDLYAEDFCLKAQKDFGIPVEVTGITCVHHSSDLGQKECGERYSKALAYLNEKYKEELFGGTVSPIGGKDLPIMTDSEFAMYRIRYELKTNQKM